MMTASNADGLQSESSHARPFPMWVVSVSDVLGMSPPVQPHEEVLKSGQAVLHEPGFHTIFISHQWLGRHHPDADGRQFQVLQQALGGCISGKLLKECDLVQRFWTGNRMLSSDERLAVRDGYVWLDWFSVPQNPAKHTNQVQAIQSIPSYVESCNMFLALVPRLPHESGNTCDYESWMQGSSVSWLL